MGSSEEHGIEITVTDQIESKKLDFDSTEQTGSWESETKDASNEISDSSNESKNKKNLDEGQRINQPTVMNSILIDEGEGYPGQQKPTSQKMKQSSVTTLKEITIYYFIPHTVNSGLYYGLHLIIF